MTRSTKAISHIYRGSDLLKLAGLSLLYKLLSDWTIGNLSINGSVSVFWLPSGVALAALLLGGIKYWPAVFVGTLVAVGANGYPLWRELGIASGNTLEALIGAWLLLRSDRFDVTLMHAEDYLRIFLAGTAGACSGALIGASVLLLAGGIAPPAFAGTLLHWYEGDILSILLLTPLILVWRRLPGGWFARTRVVETVCCFGLALLLGQITFVGWGQNVFGHPPLGHLAFLFVTWGAVRFGRHGALLLVFMAALQALIGAVLGRGFFAADLAGFDLNNAWMFLFALTVVGITVALLFHERNLAEQSLRQAEENLRLLAANLNEMVLAYDMNRQLVYANPAVKKLTGYSVADLRREQFICWVDPEDRARMLGHWDGLFHGGAFADEEYRLIMKDGRQRWAAASWGPILDDTGRQVGVQGSEHDITERKRAEETHLRLVTAIEQAAETIVITDPTGAILYANPAFEKTTGFTCAEALGQNPRILKSDKQDAEFYRNMWMMLAAGEVWSGHLINKRKDGTLYEEEATISPIRDTTGKIISYVAVKRDVTREVVLEEQYRQAQKMESIGRLAGGIAHDFNNLLTVINGYSKMMLGELKTGDPLRDPLAEIEKAGERAAGLTRQLLAFSRKQILQPGVLDLNTLLRDMREMLERLMGEDVEVRFAFHPDGAKVHADRHQLEQVIMNLAVNARDAMPGGGRLLIETAMVELDESYVSASPEARPGRYTMLAVSDTGIGMDEATRRRIFEPFFTTKPAGQGTGLGLAMVQGIVAQSGGLVNVYSEPGQGTAFKIYLPALAGTEVAPEKSAVVSALRGWETILVVEDQVEVRDFAAAALKGFGYRVLQAPNAAEALRICERENQPIHLVLTDVVMPHMSGRELAGRLVELRPEVKVLFMSGYTDNVIVHHGVLDEGANFIQKPFSPDVLARKVREALEPPVPAVRILVVDDEAGVRSFLCAALAQAGYEAMEAANGKQALSRLRQAPAQLVITDLVMPEGEGLETIRAIRQEFPNVGVIAISGAFGGEFLKVAEKLGADAILAKPLTAELLLAKVAEVLEMRR
jgi:PAS domain S-box-containing protein